MTTSVLSRQRLECVLFAALVLVSRLLFRSHLLYDLDSVNFALGMGRFDPTVHQPHPPGYFLYVCVARLVNSIVHDPNTALVIISIAASCGAVVMIYLLALEWFGPARPGSPRCCFCFPRSLGFTASSGWFTLSRRSCPRWPDTSAGRSTRAEGFCDSGGIGVGTGSWL